MQYQEEYKEFIQSAHQGEISGETVGLMVAKFAQYFADANMQMAAEERKLSQIRLANAEKIDPANDKPISVAKSEIITSATLEAANYNTAKVHLQNIEQMINALKVLQKGILCEYSAMGNS